MTAGVRVDEAVAGKELQAASEVDPQMLSTTLLGIGVPEGVAAVAADAPGVFSVFQNRRWDADFLTLRRLIDQGELGDVAAFESHYDRFRPTVTDRWKDKRDGGVWADGP